ncbi:minor capsid protein [Bordetella bronchiseptica]|uniref:phage head morphogenesis protein n=1 Tax=Bordetella bronchiseptica TaxID=518 RepID=UPI000528C815|nr:minor capsid protein [Bordetella bronchiseptica]
MSSSSSEIAYNQVLQRLVNAVKADIDSRLVPAVNALSSEYVQDSWGVDIQTVVGELVAKWTSQPFRRLADRLASNFVRTTLGAIDREQKRSFGIDVLQDSPEIRATMQAAAIQNANLIKSIPQRYLENVSNTVLANMRTGLLPREVAKQIEEEYDVTRRRARFIARDQTAKVNGELTKQRQIDAGYEFFSWMESDDERVRASHRKIAQADVGYGKGVYRWDDLPTNERGEKIQPGSDYQCRCGSRPVRNSVVRRNQERKAA